MDHVQLGIKFCEMSPCSDSGNGNGSGVAVVVEVAVVVLVKNIQYDTMIVVSRLGLKSKFDILEDLKKPKT